MPPYPVPEKWVRSGKFSKVILLPSSSRILCKRPLNFATRVLLQRPASNFKTAHRHSGPYLGQFNMAISCLHEHVMSDLDAVFHIFKGDDPIPHLVRPIAGWKDVFEDLDDSFAKAGGKPFKDEMRVGFRYGAAAG